MKDFQGSLQDAINANRMRLIDLLKSRKPEEVALLLGKEGWSREWACKAVRTVETIHNPAQLPHGAERNQAIREKLQMHAGLGAGIFLVGLIITIFTVATALAFGGLVIIAYGAIFVGAGMFIRAYPQMKRYPDRRLPVFLPPKDATRPDDY